MSLIFKWTFKAANIYTLSFVTNNIQAS
jgi:hypothetical protein